MKKLFIVLIFILGVMLSCKTSPYRVIEERNQKDTLLSYSKFYVGMPTSELKRIAGRMKIYNDSTFCVEGLDTGMHLKFPALEMVDGNILISTMPMHGTAYTILGIKDSNKIKSISVQIFPDEVDRDYLFTSLVYDYCQKYGMFSEYREEVYDRKNQALVNSEYLCPKEAVNEKYEDLIKRIFSVQNLESSPGLATDIKISFNWYWKNQMISIYRDYRKFMDRNCLYIQFSER